MKINISVALILLAFLFSSCGNNNPDDSETSGVPSVVAAPVIEIKGKMQFEQKCAACHGSDGTAGIGNAANLSISKLDSITVMNTISKGKNGMPPFSSQLTPEEIENVAGYVMTLRK
jgi:mono/diheme cytochrome c family protein